MIISYIIYHIMSVIVGIAVIHECAAGTTCNDILLSIPICMGSCIIEKYLRAWLCPNSGYSSETA